MSPTPACRQPSRARSSRRSNARDRRPARLLGAFCLALLMLVGGGAAAQDVQRIAAIVNDQVVSGFDVEQRIQLVIASTRLRDTPENRRRIRGQVLRNLVDETLQLQEAERNGIAVTDEEVERGFRTLEQQNRMPEGALEQFLAANGIAPTTLERQVRAEIAWGKLIGRRIMPTLSIGDDEVDELLSRLEASQGKPLARVSEIFLPVDSPSDEAEVLATAERLVQQLRGGADFGAIARQFSRGTTAREGGDVGWVQEGQLAPRLDQALTGLQPGGITDPIRSTGGIYILQLVDRRTPNAADPMQVRLTMKQVILPIPASAGPEEKQAKRALGVAVSERANGCTGLEQAVQGLDSAQVADVGTVRLGEMPENVRAAVAPLEVGQVSAPLEIGGAFIVLVVCEKDVPKVEPPTRRSVFEQLARQRAALLANRYLRDLRRAAVVELR